MSQSGQIAQVTGSPTPVVADIGCRSLYIRENTPGNPTTEFDVFDPSTAALPVHLTTGEGYTFTAPSGNSYAQGGTVGYVRETTFAAWQPSFAYTVNTQIIDSNGNIQKCTTAGTSGASAPPWATSGTTSDNTAVWTFIGPLVFSKVHTP